MQTFYKMFFFFLTRKQKRSYKLQSVGSCKQRVPAGGKGKTKCGSTKLGLKQSWCQPSSALPQMPYWLIKKYPSSDLCLVMVRRDFCATKDDEFWVCKDCDKPSLTSSCYNKRNPANPKIKREKKKKLARYPESWLFFPPSNPFTQHSPKASVRNLRTERRMAAFL